MCIQNMNQLFLSLELIISDVDEKVVCIEQIFLFYTRD